MSAAIVRPRGLLARGGLPAFRSRFCADAGAVFVAPAHADVGRSISVVPEEDAADLELATSSNQPEFQLFE